ncbi:hypothetical protein L6452_06965 [Arctium lappa]|uniref:Uncharacterized protein n=1 Tax=Arctium lappa TaxID=4217 RepID=A0ACB9EKC0_ARCLA|nr:hypothetical protein L6452_06965 [Arctium lappa]
MNLTRKKSPGTYKMESSTPKVLSRYLRGPTGSCHDNCKCVITTQPIEPKPINPFPKRVPKPPADRRNVDADHSVNKPKKAPSLVPKAPTRITNVKNNKFVKDEGIKRDFIKFSTKKDVAIEPKIRDLKPKSQISRTNGRRHSDVFQPNENMVLQSRVPRRRLSDVGTISNASSVRGSSINKNESRKDSKPPSVMNKKPNSSLKPIVSSPKPGAKVLPPLRSYRSLPKPELKGSRKLKPTKTIGVEVVPEKTLQVIERTKSQIPISSTSSSSSSSSEEKVITCNGLQESCSTSMEDDTPATDGQHDDEIEDSEDKTAKEVGNLVVETIENQLPISSTSSSSSSSEEKVITCNELQEACSPSMEDNTPATDSQHENEIEDSEDKTAKEDEQVVVETIENQIPISSTSSSSEEFPPSMEDDNPATDGQKDDTIEDSEDKDANRVGKLVVETEDGSLGELRFRRGKVVSPHSEDSSPRKMQFKQGKELEENESEKCENKSLRRLSSDGVVTSPETSHAINVDLKHQDVVEKKDSDSLNKIIEETASKLIQTRKSKVKALVGAFDYITSGNNLTS